MGIFINSFKEEAQSWAQQIYDRSSTSRWYGDRSKSNAQKT